MSQHARRTSFSIQSNAPLTPVVSLGPESEEWIDEWSKVNAKDLIDSRIVDVKADTSVEDACDLLLSEDIPCLAVKSLPDSSSDSPYLGLFDFSDVNAFLVFAATRHTMAPEDLKSTPRVDQIVSAARDGHVPVHLVSNMSEKNYLEALPHDANLISLLGVFARGAHRVLIQSPDTSSFLGIVSDRTLLAWFSSFAERSPSFNAYLTNSLHALSLPSLHMYTSVVATTSTASVLDAMRLMSEQGVSSVAVLDEEQGTLKGAVSVTDIGKIVVPSESKHILSTLLQQFITHIKEPYGSKDGAEVYPVYVVFPTSNLSYAIQKILATNSHRLFVTEEVSSPNALGSSGCSLCGIVSIVDVLSLFARIARLDVDPTRRQRHRRASSSSSSHSQSGSSSLSGSGILASPSSRHAHIGGHAHGHAHSPGDFGPRSRSGSRTSLSRMSASPRVMAADAVPVPVPGAVSVPGSGGHRASLSGASGDGFALPGSWRKEG